MATGGVDSDPASDTEDWTSPVAQFPESYAYALKFQFPSEKVNSIFVDEEIVVVADSDEKRAALDSVNTSFRITETHVEKQMITLTFKGRLSKNAESSRIKWIEDVKGKLSREIGTAQYKVIHTGPGADMARRQIEAKFPSTALSCTVSNDNQSLLLLSQDRQRLDDAELVLASGGEFVTSKKLRVSVYPADITVLTVEAIVSAVDKELSFSGGVSQAIVRAAGDALVKEARRHIADKGPAKVAEIVVTTGGRLHCKKVLNAVGPRWVDYGAGDKDQCKQDLTETVYNCLEKASDLGLKTIGIPAISSGTFQVPPDVCAQSYKRAVERFDEREGKTSLEHIYFVDVNKFLIHSLRQSFRELKTKSPQEKPKKELRVVLVGKTGVGKSALGNSILKKPGCFESKQRFKAVTDKSSRDGTELPKYQLELQVVDTPGLFEPGEKQKERIKDIQKEIVKSMSLLLPGPHVILVVFKADRFTAQEAAVYEQVKDIFSGLYNHMIVVFTHLKSDAKLDELLEDPPDEMKELIEHCNGRVAAIDNEAPESDRNQQVDKLINTILDLYKANDERIYSNEVIARCLQLMRSAEYAGKSLEEIKQGILDGDEEGVKRVLENPEVNKTVTKASRKCTIL